MKFEEVLPKMRDEGRIAIRKECRHKFEEGVLVQEDSSGNWFEVSLSSQALMGDSWSLEPRKVKRWQWAFGCEKECQMLPRIRMSEMEASVHAEMNKFEWMEKLEKTMIEAES